MDVGILTAEEGLASVFAFTALNVSFSLISIAAGAALVCSPPATSFVATSILFLTGARADFEALVARFAAALTFGDATDRLALFAAALAFAAFFLAASAAFSNLLGALLAAPLRVAEFFALLAAPLCDFAPRFAVFFAVFFRVVMDVLLRLSIPPSPRYASLRSRRSQ
jgi:hypothetical protein